MNVSLITDNGRQTLRIQRRFAHPVDKVWAAMTLPEHLSAWWPMRTDRIELTVGATIEFVDEEGNTYLDSIRRACPRLRSNLPQNAERTRNGNGGSLNVATAANSGSRP